MLRPARPRFTLLSLLASGLFAVATLTPSCFAANSQTSQTLTGTYLWEHGGDLGELEAVFTPAGEGHWEVAFRFTFSGETHTWSGTADGRLDEGLLSGRVESGRRGRVFTFRGEFKNGRFQGTHAEVSGGSEERTGTLTLGP